MRRPLRLGKATATVQGEGPDVVLIHGLLGSTRWWSRTIPALRAHFRVHAVDLEGFGARGRQGAFRIERAVPGLIDWMDRSDLTSASMVGHSLGGLIAALLAATEPERVDKLVLVDAAMLSYDPGLVRRVPGLIREVRAMPLDFPPLIAPDMLRAHPLSFVNAVWSLRTLNWSWTLARIQAPSLVLWGERDTVVPLSVAQHLAAAIPDARLEIIPNAGHNVMWEAPDAFNRAVIDFLRSTGIEA